MADDVNKETPVDINITQGGPGGGKMLTFGLLLVIGLLLYVAFFKVDPGTASLSAQYDKAMRDSMQVWDARAFAYQKNITRILQYLARTQHKVDSLDSAATAVILRSNQIILNMAGNKAAAKAYGETIRNKSDSEQVQLFLRRSQ